MKRIIAILLLVSMLFIIPAAHADLMSDARGMLQMINDFRTGDDAWYWNSDNRTVTQKTGLGRLQYDEELEAVALVRANELAECFDHTRPDGTDCFTAFPDNREYVGENIACGYLT
nr:CAP domain-containing protein [Clostridiales bacterium]